MACSRRSTSSLLVLVFDSLTLARPHAASHAYTSITQQDCSAKRSCVRAPSPGQGQAPEANKIVNAFFGRATLATLFFVDAAALMLGWLAEMKLVKRRNRSHGARSSAYHRRPDGGGSCTSCPIGCDDLEQVAQYRMRYTSLRDGAIRVL